MFRLIKYSSLIYFLGKHRDKLFRSAAVLLFAFITSLLYDDVQVYLAAQHPETLLYALIAKIAIVYGSLGFVLLQFRPASSTSKPGIAPDVSTEAAKDDNKPNDKLQALADIDNHTRLRTRYDQLLEGDSDSASKSSSTKSKRS